MSAVEQMTVLADGAEWPREWAINPGSGFREPKDKSLREIVEKAREAWLSAHLDPPTVLRVGDVRRSKFLSMVTATDYTPRVNSSYVFAGLEVEWCPGDSIALA